MNDKKILQGTVKRHPDGFGFFIAESAEHADVYIPAHSMKSAMTNDRVTIMVEKERDGRFRGEIIRILERSQKKIAGKFTSINDIYGVIKDEGKGWGSDLRIEMKKSMSAQKGDLVAAKILTYPDSGEFTGEVTEVIGDAMSALNDVRRVIVNQNIPDEFSAETLAEAKKFSGNPTEADFKNRKDLRLLPIITIDGATAKDFDDAVYVEMKSSGFHLIVAIADVSHYVKVGSAMDKDAYERGTSVYFPNFVVPMLPEALSNGLCSLNPHVPRLALVADMHFDFTGNMMNSSFYEAVIESKSRCTYGEAQEIVDGIDVVKHTSVPGVKENILRCADLAKILMAKRFKEGSLDLEVPETELEIDGAGEPIDVIKSERLFAHRLIEELMLAANVAVAKFLAAKDIPSLFRIHEPPDPLKISLLQKFLHSLGSTANLDGEKLQKKLTRALQEFTNESQANIIHILTLRSMSQAKYTLENVGHFGLGFDFYTHFTSPIRRYPDLIVHRLIKSQIGVPGYNLLSEEDIQTAGTWLSACEQRSAKSERQIQAIKKARFMKKMVGETFEGMISSVTKFGIFVLLRQYNVDGLVRLEDLSGHGKSDQKNNSAKGKQNSSSGRAVGRLGSAKNKNSSGGGGGGWEFDEENLRLVSKKSGFSFSIGEMVTVTVSAVDVEQGQINFVLESKKMSDQPHLVEAASAHRTDTAPNFKRKDNKNSFKEKKSGKFRDKFKERFSDKESDQKNNNQPYPSNKPDYAPKPRYSSLADYLDKNSKKGEHAKKQSSSTTNKPAFGASKNRKNSEKRGQTAHNSGGVRKARSQKSGGKTKSR